MEVRCWLEEWRLRSRAFILTRAARNKQVTGCGYEDDVISDEEKAVALGYCVEDSLLTEIRVARHELDRLFAFADNGSCLKQLINQRRNSFLALCSDIKIELAFWVEMCGELGLSRVEAEILACLPVPCKHHSPARALELLNALMNGNLYKIAPVVAQNRVTMVKEMVAQLSRARPPLVTPSEEGSFMAQVLQAFQCFVVAEKKELDYEEILYGGEALEHLWIELQAKLARGETLGYPDIHPFRCYSWLLSQERKEEVDGALKTVLDLVESTLAGDVAEAAADAAAPQYSSKCRAKAQREVDADKVVDNFFT